MIYSATDIKKLGTILTIWAHPDDECWTMGGLLAQASKNAQRIVCVTATKGEAGITSDESKWPQAELASIRENELQISLQILGINELFWLDCEDGKMATTESDECVARIIEIIREIQPNSIFTFGSCGLTGNTDHITIHDWTIRAVKKSGTHAAVYTVAELDGHFTSSLFSRANDKFKILPPDYKPNIINPSQASILYKLDGFTKEKKFHALQSHESQTDRFMNDKDGNDFMRSLCETEAFIIEDL